MKTSHLLNGTGLLAMVQMSPVEDRFGLLLLLGDREGHPAAALRAYPTGMCGWRYTLGAVTGKYECFRAASCIPVTHLERESVGSVSERGFPPLLWGASEPFPVQLPLGHCRGGGSTVMESRACFWLREKGLTQAGRTWQILERSP